MLLYIRRIRKGIRRNRKGQKLQFLNQLLLRFSHIDTHVLTSHIGKLAKLLFFEACNIAISEPDNFLHVL